MPYRGGAPALQDLVAGQIDFMCDFAANSLEQFRSGNVRAYAVMAKHRWQPAPDVPTADEAGLPGFYISNWSGLWAPAGTPQPIIAKLNAAIVAALADENTRKRYEDLGQEMPPVAQQTPQALRDLHKAEVEKGSRSSRRRGSGGRRRSVGWAKARCSARPRGQNRACATARRRRA